MVWPILRYESLAAQIIQRWKAFFYEVEHQTIDKHTAEYLPTINKSPAKMDTVQEVLRQVKEKAQALNLKETDAVLDHATYCNAKLLRL